MIGLRKDITKNLIVGFMISIMAMLFVNQILNMHTHVLPDGEVITHSHPYSKSGKNGTFPGHNHTNCEYHILSHVYLLFLALIIGIVRSFTSIGRLQFAEHIYFVRNIFSSQVKGRAPPVLLF